MVYDLIIVGGGAAGFFTAIQCVERNPDFSILILEKSKEVLSKVRVSGGGRCNVTHACFDPREMVSYYPRGNKELLGPFHRFLCRDMMAWLANHGVETKIEEDGRVFPTSNSSASIINCFLDACNKHKVSIKTSTGVASVQHDKVGWKIDAKGDLYKSRKLLIATGSSLQMWEILKNLGHQIITPVPSLFTFNIKDALLKDLPGISFPQASVKINAQNRSQSGPLLITHWGLSGPAILKLSAWQARALAENGYQFEIAVNWIGQDQEDILVQLNNLKQTVGKRKLINGPLFELPKRFWNRVIELLKLNNLNYADLKAAQMQALANMLCNYQMRVSGKSTFKDEFVTCGGVDTKEINFKTMESKLFPGLFLAGEILNIDAVTGGFNFQAAWTESFIAAEVISVLAK